MSPVTHGFSMDPSWQNQLKRDYETAVQAVVDDLIASRSSRGFEETKAALAEGLAPAIVLPNETLDEWARAIVDGDSIKVDLRFI